MSRAFRRLSSATPARGNLHNGNNLYHGKCGACHGGAAEGNPALKAPRLAGLDAAYIKRQFAHFRDGVRGTDPQDVPGRQMAMMAKTLPTERDLDDVIAFIHQQGRAQVIRALVLVMALMAAVATAGATVQAPAEFTLNATCPPGFEKTGAGVCELRTLYQFYTR